MMQDYTEFSRPQMIVSAIGCIGGFLCIRHPDLIKARPFCVSHISFVAPATFLSLRINKTHELSDSLSQLLGRV